MNLDSNRVVTIGWDCRIIKEIFTDIEKKTNLKFSHFVYSKDYNLLKDNNFSEIYEAPFKIKKTISYDSLKFLKELEAGTNITINNIINSDRVLKHRKFSQAKIYVSDLSEKIYDVFKLLKPLYVLGSWDGAIQGVGMLVARKLNIPFVTTKFSVIPAKHMTFCTYPNNNDELPFTLNNYEEVYEKAVKSRNNWINGFVDVPAYVSSKTIFDVLKKTPIHLIEVVNRFKNNYKYGKNNFVYYEFFEYVNIFLRKKKNIFLMNKSLFIDQVPKENYIFYGLHMQPESTIDVMAPFYSNQIEIVRHISRAAPIDHKILIKIHISDSDNYSNKELKKFLDIPNVFLVSPFVGSKEFIVNAKLLISIQGTIALEGSLLGKPVIVFGDSAYLKFDSVKKIKSIEDLPLLVEKQLKKKKNSDEQILSDYTRLLMNYLPSCDDDWRITLQAGLSLEEKKNFIALFKQLTLFIRNGNFKY